MLATIGYEGATVDAVLRALLEAGVRHLVDVRAVPRSRKPGFSKRQLAAALEQAGLRYTNLRALGTPPDGRLAARRGDTPTMQRIFRAHMQDGMAQAELALARQMAAEAPCCLLCFERDAACCHRRLVAEMIQAEPARDLLAALEPG
jgi:uncharacterized protein (DUF488 family)